MNGLELPVFRTHETQTKIINSLFPDAILCMETALFYYRYSDRNPVEWNITIDKNTSRQRTQIDYPFVKAYRVEPALLSVGETKGEIDFTEVRIYDRDRTICDILRNMNKMDKEIFNKAIQNYVKDPKKNIPNLIQYAKVLRVQKRVKDFYDIYYLARRFDFEGVKLQAAILETLQKRGTTYEKDSFKRIVALAEDEDMQKRWRYFLKNIKDDTLAFSKVIEEIQKFLEPVFDAIVSEEEWQKKWSSKETKWTMNTAIHSHR